MDLQLKGKCALVAGASRGIGRAIAPGPAREGVTVAAVAQREKLLDELERESVGARGEPPVIIKADFYPEGASEKVAARALEALGRIDILINAAGSAPRA